MENSDRSRFSFVALLFLVFFVFGAFGQDSSIISKKLELGSILQKIGNQIYGARDLGASRVEERFGNKFQKLRAKVDLLHVNGEIFEQLSKELQSLDQEVAHETSGIFERKREVVLRSANCSIFANYSMTENFVCSSPAGFIFELLGEGRDQSIELFLSLFTQLPLNANQNEKDMFLLQVMMLLVDQTLTNPSQYVSHGTDHSVRVMQWAIDLHSIDEIQQGMQMNYNTTEIQSEFLLGLLGLLHDVGYSDLNNHKVPKWLHSTSGGILVSLLLNNKTNGIGSRILQAAAPVGIKVVNDFITAIATHNFDDGFCKWTQNNSLYASQCTFQTSGDPNNPTSPTTPLLNRNGTYIRSYTIGHAQKSPFTFVVRVADNLDAIRTRLTPVQNSAPLMNYFLRLYVDADLRNAVASNTNTLDATRQVAMERARNYAGLQNANGTLRDVMDKATEQSWLHFYSNWIIESSQIDSGLWFIDVFVWNQSAPLNFPDHPGPALYQINRLATSAFSCYVDDQRTFLDLVRFNFDIPLDGINNGNYLPLKSFTKKPIYNQNGPAQWSNGAPSLICDPYCNGLTNVLTISPEPCLDANNQVTDSCNNEGFSLVPPFTDLTYNVYPMQSSSSGNHNEVIIIVVVVVIVVVIFAIGIGVFIWKRNSQRSGYAEIGK